MRWIVIAFGITTGAVLSRNVKSGFCLFFAMFRKSFMGMSRLYLQILYDAACSSCKASACWSIMRPRFQSLPTNRGRAVWTWVYRIYRDAANQDNANFAEFRRFYIQIECYSCNCQFQFTFHVYALNNSCFTPLFDCKFITAKTVFQAVFSFEIKFSFPTNTFYQQKSLQF